ncbi:DUF3616 domain-containing protein [Azospirillum rugosum]|uniref:DUF3616 domain-containing protein n=1 Tax=Azospirillum rugosum TaxID=416170 RepID=A0ABS4SQK6_9PROT|nr:DUF3616 domain-containing protein [Azospirillum rugosum]MBP2294840.1 hypothetical protein [Azospirillum rugosum]MDQ0528238.1 hypothetical protein [Azospirillum rugosum]
MPRSPAHPIGTVRLDFRPGSKTAEDLSVVERAGNALFAASDEGAELVRLVTADGGASYREDAAFPLAGIFDLPAGPDESAEADIEGMAVADGWLWAVGSHSLARKKPRAKDDDAAALGRLTEVRRDPNRFLLGRIPLRMDDGQPPEPVRKHQGNTARCLPFKPGGNALTKALADDALLAPFLAIPAKENGFDVEGLAACGDRLFLGLRGPVLRGWACILELAVEEDPDSPDHLMLQRIGPDDAKVRKHFLDLDGLGIRELAFDGEDLVILAGPTMDLDGPVALWRWTDALEAEDQSLVRGDRLVRLLDLPFGERADHAEGIARVPRAGASPALLVVYDSPAPERRHGDGVDADLFALPSRYDPANSFLA